MAGNGTPVSTLATRITIDDMQAVESLRGIKNQVSSLMNSWKAQNAMLNSVGDHLGAAKAKYEGLGDAIQKQEEYITKLKSEMETIDTSTNKGSEASSYLFFPSRIHPLKRDTSVSIPFLCGYCKKGFLPW